LIAGVERPDAGTVAVSGRVGALLELGAAFHPELTGIENIMLSSVVAGLTRREARARLNDVVEFAELEAFIDAPLRTYSTGMVMRLAFSIASHVEPDVLIVDEALSVGDLSFQQRCIERMYQFRASGVTIVFVSHDPGRIRELCDEVVWLRSGRVAAAGPPMEVTARYVQSQAEAARRLTPEGVPDAYTPAGVKLEAHRNRFGSLEATIGAVHIRNEWNEPSTEIPSGSVVRLEMEVSIPAPAAPAIVSATVRRADDMICLDTYTEVRAQPAGGRMTLDIERLDLAAGNYVFDVGLYSADWARTYDYHFGAYPFSVSGRAAGAGMMAPPLTWKAGAGVVAR
ncbi:MAG TPA: Wzt carbohydrate-binding domain-containing protein, partial [Actinomycetota bacterium]|nr:Wzt carbohydrate-binding domain-containing protein [Actinomycetota bacterium]